MMGRKASLAMGNIVIGVVLGLLAQKLVALYFGDHYFGQVTFAVGFIGIAFFVTDLGMGQAHIKRVSEGRHAGDCFATFAVFKVVATAFFIVMVTGGLWMYVGLLGRTIEDTTLSVIVLVLFYYIAKSVQEIGQASFEARMEMARLQVTSLVDTLVRVGLTIVAAFVVAALLHDSGPLREVLDRDTPLMQWVLQDPASALAFAIFMGGLAAAVSALVMFLRIRERGRFRWDVLRDYATFAIPLFLTSTIGVISQQIDATALGLFLSSSDAGVFGGVRRIVFVLAAIAPALGGLLFATFSGLAARGDREQIQRHMDQSIRYLSLLILPATAFTIAFAEDVIRLTLSDAFVRGATTMGALALYMYVMTIATPHAQLVMGMGKPRILARIGVITALIVIVLDILLIPDDIKSLGIPLAGLGILGAALGTLASGLVYYLLLMRATRDIAGYRQRANIWKHALASAAMVGVLWLIDRSVMPLVQWHHFLAYAAIGAVAYALALILLRELTMQDVRFLQQSIHPLEMLRYIRDELRARRK